MARGKRAASYDEVPAEQDSGPAKIGHNGMSDAEIKALRDMADQVDRLNAERKALGQDVKAIFDNAKSRGYDVKALRAAIKRRHLDKLAREQFDGILETYEAALF